MLLNQRYLKFLILGLASIAFGLLGATCAKKPVVKTAVAPPVADAMALIGEARQRGQLITRLDSALDIQLAGTPAPIRGKFVGSIRVERPGAEKLNLLFQAYSPLGLPVLEMIAMGDRLELFTPLDRSVYVNFEELAAGDSVEAFPASSFYEISLPVDLIVEQIKLIWGMGFQNRYLYQLTAGEGSYSLSEVMGQTLRREIAYDKNLRLREVKVYQAGTLCGSMICEDYPETAGPAGFIPRTLIFTQDEVRITLKFLKLRLNREVTGQEIAFRKPAAGRLVLLTPPVP